MFKSINPATGEEIARYPELNAEQLEDRLQRAANAFHHWRASDLSARADLLARIADEFEANKDRLAGTATAEMGKTLATSNAEVEKCIAAFRHYAVNGPAMLAAKAIDLAGGGKAAVRWLPQGPVLAVMPWNFPYWQAVRFLVPTILAGNVALLKHASIVQGVAALMEEVVLGAGAPEGLFQNLGIRSDAVAKVIADERVVAVTITGSEGAGVAVAEQAGRHLKKVVLELGGSDPFVVMPSADLDLAARTAVNARIQNAGQSCICAKRMIVHADIFEPFLERFSAGLKAVKTGDPLDPGTDMGPLSSFEQRQTVLEQVAHAKEAGAKLLFGAEALEGAGAFMSPGLLVDIPPASPVRHEEIFGPVAMLFKAEDLDDAVRLANDIPFGLGSSVWTNVADEQERFIRDIEAGMAAVNRMLASSPEAPFGGIKRSGHGRELGEFGLHEFMNLKTVVWPGSGPADPSLVE